MPCSGDINERLVVVVVVVCLFVCFLVLGKQRKEGNGNWGLKGVSGVVAVVGI
jgi:preprotein translocase subunit SecG